MAVCLHNQFFTCFHTVHPIMPKFTFFNVLHFFLIVSFVLFMYLFAVVIVAAVFFYFLVKVIQVFST